MNQQLQTLAVAALCLLLAACSPGALLVRHAADELASQGAADEDDLELARDAAAFYLKLSESVLKQTPGHLKLAEAVAAGYTRYAYAFVAFEGDKIESRDTRAAQRHYTRAARLYRRAQGHAMTALKAHHPGLTAWLSTAPDAGQARAKAPALTAEQVGVVYWAAASWGAAIALSKDRPDDVADLPLVVKLATWAWQADPGHAEGGLASLMGTLESVRPGGSRAQAVRYFDQAIASGGGRNAGVFIAKAEALALPAGDRAEFEQLLKAALAASESRKDLANAAMRERALWLLAHLEDLF